MEDKIFEMTISIANSLLSTEEKYLSKGEIEEKVGEDLRKYVDIIIGALVKTGKFKGKNKVGGIVFAGGRKHSKITANDKEKIKSYIVDKLKPGNKKPEEDVQNAFENWLRSTISHEDTVAFRSNGRKFTKWRNVDGFLITIEELKYHLSFRPVLTTFEVKPSIPNVEGISQARNYLTFSHHVYIVFEDSRPREEIMLDLHKQGFDDSDGMGVYVTKDRNTEHFEKIQNTNSKPPIEMNVEEAIDGLLNDAEKKRLIEKRQEYVKKYVLKDAFKEIFR